MKIIRLLPGVFNEIDVLEENLRFYIEQGFETVVLDNGSTDGSYEVCQKYLGHGIARLERVVTERFEVRDLMAVASRLYGAFSPDWVIMADADEFMVPGDSIGDLRQAIENADAEGATLIPTRHFMFFPTALDPANESTVLRRLRYYAKADDMMRAKIWKESPSVFIAHPHRPSFANPSEQKLASKPCVMRHYPLRNEAQAKQKRERIRPTVRGGFGWSSQYLGEKAVASVVRDVKQLNRYDDDGEWKTDKVVSEVSAPLRDIVAHYVGICQAHPDQTPVLIKTIRDSSWPGFEQNVSALLLAATILDAAGFGDRASQLRTQAWKSMEQLSGLLD